jgi:hypothetical protein
LSLKPTTNGMFARKQKEIDELISGAKEKNRQLRMKVEELSGLAESMANSERDYNVAYAQKLLALKLEGCAATMSKELAKGDKGVADLLFKFRVAEAMLDACRKNIYALNTAIDTYRSLLSWEKAEMGQAGVG